MRAPTALAAHRLAEALRALGYPVPEPGEPAPLPPLAPDYRDAAVYLTLYIQEARRAGRAAEALASLAAWAARALPPWELERAPHAPLPPPRRVHRGLRGLLASLRAYASDPSLERALAFLASAAGELWRPCKPPTPGSPGHGWGHGHLLAIVVLLVSLVASLALDPVSAVLVSTAVAGLAAVVAAAHGGALGRYESLWGECRLSRRDAEALVRSYY